MLFNSSLFLFFFAAILLCMIVLPHSRQRRLMLLVASYVFYAYWDYRFTALILTSTVIDFWVGCALRIASHPIHRKQLLSISVIANLGMLGFFKYYNFFIDSAGSILSSWGLGIAHLDIILPVGISFYTFQTMSYTIDIYRRQLEPIDDFFDFALFVAFFPQLVAGPIVRASEFLPQLKQPIGLRLINVWAGLQIFIIGLFKKLMIADAVAPLVDGVYNYPEYFGSFTVWLAVIAYSLQIYGDFSGYSDMAIGCARILGFRFSRNFDMPYLSQNVTAFWQRWHMSLSSWLRDYLYIPLGGNRRGAARTYVNLIATMGLGGLWHGASWNFVVWGLVHGIALALHRMCRCPHLQVAPVRASAVLVQILGTAATFLFVTLVWVLFRAPDTSTGITVYSKLLFVDAGGATWNYVFAYTAIFWCVLGHWMGSMRKRSELVWFETPVSYRAAFATIMILLIMFVFAPLNASPFIYFQF